MPKIALFIASLFYVGRFPKAPGTVASLVALPLAWWVWKLEPHFAWAIIIGIFLVGIWSAHAVIKSSGV
jgi:phosphatidylglycerophosphatase A